MKRRASTPTSLLAIGTAALLIFLNAPSQGASPPSNQVRLLKTIYSFPSPELQPSSLVPASDGSFYVAARLGGDSQYGLIYHLDHSGALLTVHEFSGDNTAYPTVLALAGDGRLYGGSTGLNNLGSVYRIEPTGELQLLHEYAGGEDGVQAASLVAGADGNIYGFSYSSSGTVRGSFFRILPDGTFSVVRQFHQTDEVFSPGALVETGNGVFFGLGASADGSVVVFRMNSEGAVTPVHSYPSAGGSEGARPNSLIAGKDGNAYGTTPGYYWAWHGVEIINNPATVFQCTAAGVFRELHSFSPGSLYHRAPLVQRNDGSLFCFSADLLSRLTTAGDAESLYWGESILDVSLTEGLDHEIYGMVRFGGDFGSGRLFQVVFGQPRAVNLSSRLNVGTGDEVSIGGFIVTGDVAKRVMLRAIGSSLGLPEVLDDPSLELHDASGAIIGRNNDWRVTLIGGVIAEDQSGEIQAGGLAPSGDRESALIATLQPGSYTAVASGNQGGTGIGLVEIYDLADETSAQLTNISTRGLVDTGNKVMIGGLIVDSTFAAHTNIVFRAIGPSLSQSGTSNSLQDPSLVIHNEDGTVIAANDNWRDDQPSELISLGLAPTDDRESAVYISLSAGSSYTAVVSGQDGTSGVALVEVYNVQ